MTFDEILTQVLDLLRRDGRVSYRALKRRFELDDEYLEDLKAEIIKAKQLAVDEDGEVLVWTGGSPETFQRERSAISSLVAPVVLQSYTPPHLANKILTAKSALEGERRQVTVLFADMQGFTTLSEQLDPEEVHQIISHCFELITTEVHRFEGTINQYTGDGVMALFGAPIAHEDGPRRAVHAALAIQRALGSYSQKLQTQRGFGVQMRIGLNTGLVVVGKIGDDLRMDYTAVGDTTNLAARLEQLASPGSIVISETTHKLVSGFFETHDLGLVEIKGHTPVQAFEVRGARGRRTTLDVAAERGLTPFVGRDRELDILTRCFERVKAGQGQGVFIVGEAGIGKSRLLLEFRRALAQAGENVTWREGRCISFGRTIPFLPIIDQLRQNFGIDEFDGEPEIIAKVEDGMRRMGELEAHIPYIRRLLSVTSGEPTLTHMEPALRRKQTLNALYELVRRGAQLRPLIIVIEDLHWIDISTEEYLTALIDAVTCLPVMVLLTYRVGYSPPFGQQNFFTTLTLQSLPEADALTMAGQVLGTQQFPDELKAALLEKAEGVPLFVEEVTKTLLDLGILHRENGTYRMMEGMADVSVPDTIQGIIMARLDRLGETGKRTVQLASVIGRQFLVRLLERISDVSEKLEGLLAELQTLEVIYRQGLLPEPAYIFKHAVIQDVAYNSLLVQRRKELHRAVGQAIEELYADRLTEHQEELAYHYERGEVWPKALEYAMQAGQKLQQAYANQEALVHYDRALAICNRLGDAVESKTLLALYAGKGAVHFLLSEFFPSVDAYQHMRDVARQLGDHTQEAEALYQISHSFFGAHEFEKTLDYVQQAKALASTTGARNILAASLYVEATVRQVTGKLDEAVGLFEAALTMSQEVGDSNIQGLALTFLGFFKNWHGHYEQAQQFQERGITISRAENLYYPLAWLYWSRGISLGGQGAYEAALASLNEALAVSRQLGETFFKCRILNTFGWMYGELYNLDTAIEYNRESAEESYKVGDPEIIRNAEINLGDDYLLLRDVEQAQHYLEKVYRDSQQHGKWGEEWMKWRYLQHCCHSLGELWLIKGDGQKALAFAEECLQLAETTDSRKNIVKGWRLKGQTLLLQGNRVKTQQAQAALEHALGIATQIGNPPQLWKTYQALGQLHEHKREYGLARTAYRNALRVIEEVAEQLQDLLLKHTFLAARPVEEIRESIERVNTSCT